MVQAAVATHIVLRLQRKTVPTFSPLDHVYRDEQQIYGKLSSVGCLFPLPLSFPDINDLCPKLSSQSITQWHQLYYSHARNTSAKDSWKPIPAPAHAQRNWILAWSISMKGKKKKKKEKKEHGQFISICFSNALLHPVWKGWGRGVCNQAIMSVTSKDD